MSWFFMEYMLKVVVSAGVLMAPLMMAMVWVSLPVGWPIWAPLTMLAGMLTASIMWELWRDE